MTAFGNPPGPRDWSPPGGSFGSSFGGPPPRRRHRAGWIVGGVIAALVVGLLGVAVVLGALDGSSRRITLNQVSPTAGGARTLGTSTPGKAHLDARTPVGSCLTAAAPTEIVFVACTKPHRYELISHARASGTDTYPTDGYWNGPVGAQCYQDMLRYVGQPRDSWPAGLASQPFVPTEQGWAAGDRSIECLAEWTPDTAGSVKGLPAAASAPAAVPTATVVTLSGTLVRVDDPTGRYSGCLAVRSDAGTTVVEPLTNALSWWVSVDTAGQTIDAGSGIIRGSDPMSKDFLVHTGATTTLTGSWMEYSGPSPAACAQTRVFQFTAVG